MKKFRIGLNILKSQHVIYEVEAESREELDKMMSGDCVEDIGKCVDESLPELYSEEIESIEEVKEGK